MTNSMDGFVSPAPICQLPSAMSSPSLQHPGSQHQLEPHREKEDEQLRTLLVEQMKSASELAQKVVSLSTKVLNGDVARAQSLAAECRSCAFQLAFLLEGVKIEVHNFRHSTKRLRRKKAVPSNEENPSCRYCGKTRSQITQWRRGPDGHLSLCNACGLKFLMLTKKEKKLAQEHSPVGIVRIRSLLNDEA